MAKHESRVQFMKRLGATQRNTVCAVNAAEKKVYFSIWTDSFYKHNGKTSYVIQEPTFGVDAASGDKTPARNDQDAKFALAFDQGYETYGYFIEAKDRAANPREIASTFTSLVMQLELARLESGSIIGTPLKRIEFR
jgi:hypothetical protein